ncbi:ethanolamine kinase A [Tieghemostelium lacteum]|uniref:Vesicle transport protein n=1 Tax=Tieghemostelium lacteum TaxID=361077 RepID=A0A152A3B6_TIELA|nr:ethanolamine kinase A [Tieghemostelium lacteum]|eukprot:KYR00597.1 ethanolamine kinase A [Tieghemostelium lacteum]
MSQFDNLEFKTNSNLFSNVKNGSTQYWNDIQVQGEGLLSKLKTNIPFTNNKPVEQPTFYEEVQQQTTLSYFQRITIFLIFIALGVAFIIMSTFFIITPRIFAKFYTAGSIFIIIGLVVLVGVKKHLQNMFSSTERFYSSIIYALSVAATLYSALSLRSTPLTFIFVITQFLAIIWYSLSYIPFGQTMLKSLVSKIIS